MEYGATPAFTFDPDAGYHVESVLVDGVAVTPAPQDGYTFAPITAAHTPSVSFAAAGAPQPRPLPGYATVLASRGGWAQFVFRVRSSGAQADVTLQILGGGGAGRNGLSAHAARVVKTIKLGDVATNRRLTARFRCALADGVYGYRIVATDAAGRTGRYTGGHLAVGARPTIYIEGGRSVVAGVPATLQYLIVDRFAAKARLTLLVMRPAKAGGGANHVVKRIALGERATNTLGSATFTLKLAPGLYRYCRVARDGTGVTAASTSNLVWVYRGN